jgi:hypothetical protein
VTTRYASICQCRPCAYIVSLNSPSPCPPSDNQASPMLLRFLCSFALGQLARASTSSSSSANTVLDYSEQTSFAASLTEIPTGNRATYYTASITNSFSTYSTINATAITSINHNGTNSTSAAVSISSATQTTLAGTLTKSSSSSTPTSGAKCNGYSELCERKYSNITYVVAHNSPFHVPNNAASNQVFDVTTQLDNGIRGLQSETHYVNNTVFLCHTSCSELNAGTLEAYLVKVKAWLDNNRMEVITILLGNEDFIDPGNYTAPVTNSGILDYIYTPPTQPMNIDGWPTLADMIISNKRVVMMLAYDANQEQVPWLLDFWSYQWQTPFSPTNVS